MNTCCENGEFKVTIEGRDESGAWSVTAHCADKGRNDVSDLGGTLARAMQMADIYLHDPHGILTQALFEFCRFERDFGPDDKYLGLVKLAEEILIPKEPT